MQADKIRVLITVHNKVSLESNSKKYESRSTFSKVMTEHQKMPCLLTHVYMK